MSIAEKLVTVAENQQKVFDAGKQAEYDRFWDVFQDKGARRIYSYAFYGTHSWKHENFKPKYPFYVSYGISMFSSCTLENIDYDIEFTNGIGETAANNIFSGAKVKRIKKLVMRNTLECSGWFKNCTALEDITFENANVVRSELITMPFNEAFEVSQYYYGSDNVYSPTSKLMETYSDYVWFIMNWGMLGFYICCTDGENFERIAMLNVYYNDGFNPPLPDWFVPEDKTQNVSFYIEKPDTVECISSDIDFGACPLNRKSILNVFESLSSTVTGKTLTLKKTAVNNAFSMDVDDKSTWDALFTEYYNAKRNWTISYI